MTVAEIEVDVDHVHVLIEIPPQMSVGMAVKTLKSVSARMMFKRFTYLRAKFFAERMWGGSYFVRSVGEGVTGEMVARYIASHEEKSTLGPVQAQLFPGPKGRGTPKRRT
jgi:putative transposase